MGRKEKLELLKTYATQFYLGGTTEVTDKEYDQLEMELGVKGLSLVEFQGKEVAHEYQLPGIDKIKLEGDLIKESLSIIESSGKHIKLLAPKYDGTSVIAEYKNGKLWRISTHADEEVGLDQTSKLYKHFPDQVDKDIIFIQGEAVVNLDKGFGYLSRQKANGLVNSNSMQEEVNELLTIIGYRVGTLKGVFSTSDFTNLPTNPRFSVTQDVRNGVMEGKFLYFNRESNDGYLIDGIVAYFSDGSEPMAFKFYYGESEVTDVIDIEWNETDNESFSSRVIFNPIEIEGCNIQRASTNGARKLFEDLKCGIGSEIRVSRSGSTIPQIIEVIKESHNYNIPKCRCGTQLTEDDIYGSNLRCPNKYCIEKMEYRKWILSENLKDITSRNELVNELPNLLPKLLHVERVNIDFLKTEESIKKFIKENIGDLSKEDEWVELITGFGFSYLASRIIELHAPSTWISMCNYFNELN